MGQVNQITGFSSSSDLSRLINKIVLGKRAITADTALRPARYFGVSEGFWMGLQADYDLEETRRRLGDRLEKEVRPYAA